MWNSLNKKLLTLNNFAYVTHKKRKTLYKKKKKLWLLLVVTNQQRECPKGLTEIRNGSWVPAHWQLNTQGSACLGFPSAFSKIWIKASLAQPPLTCS